MILHFYRVSSCLQLLRNIEKLGTFLSLCIFEHKSFVCWTYPTFFFLHLFHIHLFTPIWTLYQHWFLSRIKRISWGYYSTSYTCVCSLWPSWLSSCCFVEIIDFSLKTLIIKCEFMVCIQQFFLFLFHHIYFIQKLCILSHSTRNIFLFSPQDLIVSTRNLIQTLLYMHQVAIKLLSWLILFFSLSCFKFILFNKGFVDLYNVFIPIFCIDCIHNHEKLRAQLVEYSFF